MSRWEPISLQTGLVADIGREVTSSIRAVVNHAAVQGIGFSQHILRDSGPPVRTETSRRG